MKQSITAVEWYAKQMQLKDYFTQEDFDKIFNQAKEMEKKQRGYSEEDMKIAFDSNIKDWISFEEFIEQFKNK